uniref:Turripeptide Lol6.2 n=1 Tax=Iotyrris olangoensis TaxID=2420066 RepID=TU25_IOTOL|nr:RecName: Full=Turripeptide Lol6.2; AltName: Full=OL25 [Iotyrris olangoensis]
SLVCDLECSAEVTTCCETGTCHGITTYNCVGGTEPET